MEEFCYVIRKPCGCAIGAYLIEPANPGKNADMLADYMRSGCTIDRMTGAEFNRQGGWSKKCEHAEPVVGEAK